ncbi:MAG: site-specific integrase [Bdellovibrionota bacterium]
MYWQKRINALSEPYYSFIQWNPAVKKNIRLKQREVPANITSDKQADEFCKLREHETEAIKARIEQKLDWQKKFYKFEELLKICEKEAMKKAPNSFISLNYYLRQYGFDYFLNKKQCNNINNWHLYFEDFREWLITTKTIKTTQNNNTLSYSSKNNIIGAINFFLDVMYKKGKCQQSPKCQKFPRHLLNFRDAKHVIDENEAQSIISKLNEVDPSRLSSDFFTVLLNTGLRLGEGLSISLNDFYPGMPDNKIMKGALDRHKLNPHGYISLESQLGDSVKPRGLNNAVIRKPLKGRKRIDAKSSRIIPVINKACFNALATRFNIQCDLLSNQVFGSNRSDYLLFDGLTKNRFSRILREAYKKTKYFHKSPHCARHTFATNFAGLSNADTMLCRLVLGHKDEDTTLGYVHIFEQINRQTRLNSLIKAKIDLIL